MSYMVMQKSKNNDLAVDEVKADDQNKGQVRQKDC